MKKWFVRGVLALSLLGNVAAGVAVFMLRRPLRYGLMIVSESIPELQGLTQFMDSLSGAAAPTKEATVQATKVRRGSVSRLKSFAGTVHATQAADLAFGRPGILAAVLVKAGSFVRKGQELFRLQDGEARSELAKAQAVKNAAQANYERIKSLYNQKIQSKAGFEKAKQDFEVASADVDLTQERFNQTRIFAPIDGVVGIPTDVFVGSPIEQNRVITRIVNPDVLEVIFHPSEVDVKNMYVGQKIVVSLGSGKGSEDTRMFSALISALSPYNEERSHTSSVKALIGRHDGFLREGSSVSVTVPVGKVKNALIVSNDCIMTDSEGSTVYQVLSANGQKSLKQTPVTLGVRGLKETQILHGLKIGDLVVSDVSNELGDGMPVKIEMEEVEAGQDGKEDSKEDSKKDRKDGEEEIAISDKKNGKEG